ncbi:threonine/homoserine/homoserine lactone efflux protein [Geodermatophilus tzadiensis]|uniref:Threonine/homoserine/homoserine lactone efflux protein n=1 Tax=Geodermatophilus tzadiensis TaxID=1137988 RepID=A0A2T0TP71_9ACTN|nr:LysE family translocator [Geodermatophilus tzadiensis]PRY47524.1 threonine/homoserine/homoserine lactone efflux protein [Geodermatophilus tzadiensis]
MDAVAPLGAVPAFLGVVLLIAATPGPAVALIVRRAALRGAAAAVPTVLGLEVGLLVWALLAGAGVAAAVAASEAAYLVLRVAGAVVLLWLGGRALWRACRGDADAPGSGGGGERAGAARRAFGEGVVVQLANPKLAVLVVALYPQFGSADGHPLLTAGVLGLLQVAVESVLYLALAAGVGRAGAWFRRPRVRRGLDAVAGTVLVGMGVRVAGTAR